MRRAQDWRVQDSFVRAVYFDCAYTARAAASQLGT
jgi:hypothetical protein